MPLQLKVNEEYARRFQHNKEREELHRLKEKHPEAYARLELGAAAGGDSETEESDDEDEDMGEIPEVTGARGRGRKGGTAAGLGSAVRKVTWPVHLSQSVRFSRLFGRSATGTRASTTRVPSSTRICPRRRTRGTRGAW